MRRLDGLTAWMLRGAAVVGACVVAAMMATWPLAVNLPAAVLLGTEHEATVPVFNLWTLWWTADRAAHAFVRYWDAPFFYPNAGVFTYSEPQPLTGLLVAPLWAMGAPPALIYNAALLALLILNGVFAYRVVRALDLPRLSGILGGVLMVTLPFIANMYGALQLVALFGLLWTLEGLVRFGRDGALRHAVWAATGFVAAYLTCEQYALMFAFFGLVAGLVALAQQGFRVQAAVRLAVVGVMAGLVVVLVAWPAYTLHAQLGFVRSAPVVQHLSARLGDFVTRPGDAWATVPPRSWADTAGLFPGVILLGLAVAGVVVGGRHRDRALRRWTAYFAGSALMAMLLAQGLNLTVFGWLPFETLRTVLPPFDELRSPFRFAAIMQMALPILAALVLAHLQRRFVRVGAALMIMAGLLGALENLTIPITLARVPLSAQTAWTAWLRAQPDGTVIAHIPFAPGPRVSDYAVDAWQLFAQIDHHKPLVNGYSGYFPPGYSAFQFAMATRFPQSSLLCELAKGLHVTTLVVDQSWLAAHKSQMAIYATFLQSAYRDNQMQIYRLRLHAGECTPS